MLLVRNSGLTPGKGKHGASAGRPGPCLVDTVIWIGGPCGPPAPTMDAFTGSVNSWVPKLVALRPLLLRRSTRRRDLFYKKLSPTGRAWPSSRKRTP